MRTLKLGWGAFLLIAFTMFSTWYGGNGTPIGPEEGAELVKELRATYANAPSHEQNFIENIQAMIPDDDGKEFYAVNLEQLKQGKAAEQADRAYAQMVIPLLFKRAAHPVFVSNRAGLMLGEYGNQVDRVAVVRYRSLRDLINMVNEPAMVAGSPDKFASLDHTEVFITRPVITFLHLRFALALVLILVGLGGLKGIDIIENRRLRRSS